MEENQIGQNEQGGGMPEAFVSNEEAKQQVSVPGSIPQAVNTDSIPVTPAPAPAPLVLEEKEGQQVPAPEILEPAVLEIPAVLEPVVSETTPVVQSPAQAVETAKEAEGVEKKVLLVEDDAFLNSLMKTKLERAGISVNLVTDGEEALKVLETFRPNLILLDLILPKKSGFEVLESIQTNPKLNKMPVIILSNLGQESDVSKGRQLGAVEYFVKAKTSIDELVSKVAEFLQGKNESLS
ncbi:MAG: response regulator [Candidatus Paceibacterota bacterium]